MGYGYGYGFDVTYILVLIGAGLCLLASALVKSTFKRYSKVYSRTNMTGAEAARRILQSQGIYDVSVQQISGSLTDHYDPSAKVLRLSQSVFNVSSVAAIGVAAHECGHAVQHHKGYLPLNLRSALVPVANIGAKLSWPVILVGLLIGGSASSILLRVGILMFCAVVAFQIVTLPVEFNASSRAMVLLEEQGILYREEVSMVRKVLTAAALTYVASVASSLLQLLRLIMIANRRRN